MPSEKPKIAVFSGPTATIQNSPPLLTSNKARLAYGLEPLTDAFGQPLKQDAVRAQRLAAPVTVYIDYLSAHPLEEDAADLYAPPDGYLAPDGTYSEAPAEGTRPVYRVTLEPSDGLYMLPYMGRQQDGKPWDEACAFPLAPSDLSRQTFYPDASRIYEEIDRFGLNSNGEANLLSGQADFDFYRPAPSGGWRKGRAGALRADVGEGDIAPEVWGEDFFMYYPRHLRAEPYAQQLARATNVVAKAMATGEYLGGQWLEGSPTTEESMYWLNLLIDTKQPLVGHSAQRPHQTVSADGDKNIYDGVKYITSKIWVNGGDADAIGGVMIVDEQVFHSREVTKTDARPGNYQVTGGHGGIVALMGGYAAPQLTYVPSKRHTWKSEVNLSRLPDTVPGLRGGEGSSEPFVVQVKDASGFLVPEAMPKVTLAKYARYQPMTASAEAETDVEIMARVQENLRTASLAGFVGEGASPYGSMNRSTDEAMRYATFSGMPIVRCGRGATGGIATKMEPTAIAGNNLTSTKARILLMASLLKFGALPPAKDPMNPTPDEVAAVAEKVALYQAVFDTH
jgi:L-asparaginase